MWSKVREPSSYPPQSKSIKVWSRSILARASLESLAWLAFVMPSKLTRRSKTCHCTAMSSMLMVHAPWVLLLKRTTTFDSSTWATTGSVRQVSRVSRRASWQILQVRSLSYRSNGISSLMQVSLPYSNSLSSQKLVELSNWRSSGSRTTSSASSTRSSSTSSSTRLTWKARSMSMTLRALICLQRSSSIVQSGLLRCLGAHSTLRSPLLSSLCSRDKSLARKICTTVASWSMSAWVKVAPSPAEPERTSTALSSLLTRTRCLAAWSLLRRSWQGSVDSLSGFTRLEPKLLSTCHLSADVELNRRWKAAQIQKIWRAAESKIISVCQTSKYYCCLRHCQN